MSFEDLPDNHRDLPLTDQRLAGDLVDLLVRVVEREAGCLLVLVCDDQHRGQHPMVIRELPAVEDHEERRNLELFLDELLGVVRQAGGSVLFAHGRAAGLRADDADRAWHQVAIDLCAAHEVRLLGFHVATADGVFRLPDPLRAAS